MQASPNVMRRVVAEVSREDVVPLVGDVPRCFVIVIGIQAVMMRIRVPSRNEQGNGHGQRKHEQRILPVVKKEDAQNQQL